MDSASTTPKDVTKDGNSRPDPHRDDPGRASAARSDAITASTLRDSGDQLVQLVSGEAVERGVDVTVGVMRPDASFRSGTGLALAIHLYSVEPQPPHDAVDLREDIEVKGTPYTVFRPPPLPVVTRWAIAARADDAGGEHALLTLALRAIHAHEPGTGTRIDGRASERASADSLSGIEKTSNGTSSPQSMKRGTVFRFDSTFDLERQTQLSRALGVPHHPLVGCVARVEVRSERELRRVRRVDARTISIRRSSGSASSNNRTGRREESP